MRMTPDFRNAVKALTSALVLSAALDGQTLNTLYSFMKDKGGREPLASVAAGPNGEMYGTATHGGASDLGVVYELIAPVSEGGTWTETVLHSFSSQNGDGQVASGLAIGASGALYGVTEQNTDGGTTFQLKPPAGASTHWREKVLHIFGSGGDGANPTSAPILGPRGALYGTTVENGGAVYELQPPAPNGAAWTEEILHSFPSYAGDGAAPAGGLAIGSDGTLYGTTSTGGADEDGTIFQLIPPGSQGGSWAETLLYSFDTETGDAEYPNGVTLGPDGALYGTAMGSPEYARCRGCGTVFQLSPPTTTGGAWTETILHTFAGPAGGDGSQPDSRLALGTGGVLYGTTLTGGGEANAGTIFEMVPPTTPGGTWTEVVLYSFTGGADGYGPNGVTLGADGNLYGTTFSGGANNEGTVFQLVLQ